MDTKPYTPTRTCCEVNESTHKLLKNEIEKLLEAGNGRGIFSFLASPSLCRREAEKAMEEIETFVNNKQAPGKKIAVRQITATDEPPTYPIGFTIQYPKF
ncbi:MAG: hypothetical protein Q8P01_02660 [bacterium]|nr:hypothetical protein [bacterium]